jgi:hypothetical protein
MSPKEKYGLALYYMQMLDRPKKFMYLDRFITGDKHANKGN